MRFEEIYPAGQLRQLAAAAAAGNVFQINRLLQEGVDINGRGMRNATALFWAFRNLEGFEALLQRGADPNIVFDDGGSVMHIAARLENTDFLEMALRYGGNANLQGGDGRMGETPIFVALRNERAVAMLISAGADVNAPRSGAGGPTRIGAGDTPLHLALMLDDFDIARYLIENGADVNAENELGVTISDLINSSVRRVLPNSERGQALGELLNLLRRRGVPVPIYPS